ncbi:hypothetical protein DSO57_1021602 [Entomophthora muscae]|uniref:Uncharacterized protein n=1 Tax=Entomophthora muscae TaxID=34485 RepID=A0ACC2UCE3_9FUNG|nr:hypothetical protein DSO57_1021602 [Entomophthora muscae]
MLSVFSFLSLASATTAAAIPEATARSFLPGGILWGSFPQQGFPWFNIPQSGTPWYSYSQNGKSWEISQEGNPWQGYPQREVPWNNPQQGNPWKGYPQRENHWDTPQQGNPWEGHPQRETSWDNQQETHWKDDQKQDQEEGRSVPEYPQHGPPTPENSSEQGGFDINEMLKQVNRLRAKVGAGPLHINQKLMTAALRHSLDQAKSHRMSHTGSDGSDLTTRSSRVNYKYLTIAENVAFNQRSVSEVMKAWINSPGHYANLVNRQYKDFGAAMVNYYWTQNFGTSQ